MGPRSAPHNTVSLRITVHYRFHPFAGKELRIVSAPRRPEFPIIVRRPDGIDLKIPLWMTDPAAARIELSHAAVLPVEVLGAVADRVASFGLLQPPAEVSDSSATKPSKKEEQRWHKPNSSISSGARRA